MKLKDVPVGSTVYFGSYRSFESIAWAKVSEDNDLVTRQRIEMARFDGGEPASDVEARVVEGYNFFPVSNILQWLNGRGRIGECYRPMHDSDYLGYPDEMKCFLSQFDQWEYDLIEERELTVHSPKGSVKQYGKQYTLTTKVFLPSAAEIVESSHMQYGVEGEFNLNLHDALYGTSALTRTGVRDSSHVAGWNGEQLHSIKACSNAYIHPMLRLSGDAEVEPDEPYGYVVTPIIDKNGTDFAAIVTL